METERRKAGGGVRHGKVPLDAVGDPNVRRALMLLNENITALGRRIEVLERAANGTLRPVKGGNP